MTGEEFLADFWARARAFGEQRRTTFFRTKDLLANPPSPKFDGRTPRRFHLNRNHDESGVSGTGLVAWGTEFPNGKVALTWAKDLSSQTWFDSVYVLEAIHGHQGATEIVWIDDK